MSLTGLRRPAQNRGGVHPAEIGTTARIAVTFAPPQLGQWGELRVPSRTNTRGGRSANRVGFVSLTGLRRAAQDRGGVHLICRHSSDPRLLGNGAWSAGCMSGVVLARAGECPQSGSASQVALNSSGVKYPRLEWGRTSFVPVALLDTDFVVDGRV